MTKIPNRLHKYVPSMLLFLLFEAVAVTLWLTKENFFYLLNFSYIAKWEKKKPGRMRLKKH